MEKKILVNKIIFCFNDLKTGEKRFWLDKMIKTIFESGGKILFARLKKALP